MTQPERPALSAALSAVSANTDESTRIKACRSIVREAMKKIILIGGGTYVEGIEEIEFTDALDRELLAYLKAKRSRVYGATYVGITGPMDEAIAQTHETITAGKAITHDQGGGES